MFKKYPIPGVKALDFKDFCRAAELMKEKKHLTPEGLEQIKKIKAGMNSKRITVSSSLNSTKSFNDKRKRSMSTFTRSLCCFTELYFLLDPEVKVIPDGGGRPPVYELLTPEGDGLQFFTLALNCFNELHYLFYLAGKKVIPHNIYEILTPVTLAHILMGDGVTRNHGIIICTDSYSTSDVVRLMGVLIIRYKLDCILPFHMPANHPRIYIRERSMPLLRTIVRPHMHSSITYKIKPSGSKAHYKTTQVSFWSKDFHLDP